MKDLKPTPLYRMKVVPHRPLRVLMLWVLAFLVFFGSLVSVHFYTIYQERKTLLSPEESGALRTKIDDLEKLNETLQEQLTHYQVTTDVDHQAAESVRKQVLEQQEKIAELERSIAVYRMMLAKDFRNPKGVSYGSFSVAPNEQPNSFHLKLVVQKLLENDADFEGELRWLIAGKEAGKEKKYALHELSTTKINDAPLSEIIPLAFKVFQNVEVDIQLPDAFVAERVELQVTSPKRDSTRVENQLEWPRTPAVTQIKQ